MSDPTLHAIQAVSKALHDRLSEALKAVEEADNLLVLNNRLAAFGSLLDLPEKIASAKALAETILILHRTAPRS